MTLRFSGPASFVINPTLNVNYSDVIVVLQRVIIKLCIHCILLHYIIISCCHSTIYYDFSYYHDSAITSFIYFHHKIKGKSCSFSPPQPIDFSLFNTTTYQGSHDMHTYHCLSFKENSTYTQTLPTCTLIPIPGYLSYHNRHASWQLLHIVVCRLCLSICFHVTSLFCHISLPAKEWYFLYNVLKKNKKHFVYFTCWIYVGPL